MTVTELRPTESWAEQSAKASKVEAEADAVRARTAADTEARQIQNRLKAAKAAAEIAEGEGKAAEIREQSQQRIAEAAEQAAAARTQRARAEKSAQNWRNSARAIAVICIVVSLPLQMMAFYSKHAWFLVLAPLVLEGLAWALLQGAAAAIDEGRPSWHYRLLALGQALFSAAINFMHGSHAFGLATGLGGAFCSLAGPMIWDLHEYGRIARRDGRLSWKQRRAERRQAAEDAAREAAELAAAEAKRKAVTALREAEWADVWKRAAALSAALGEVHVSESVWTRAWDDVHGTALGDTAETIAARVVAKALAKEAAGTAVAAPKPQVDPHVQTVKPEPVKGPGRGNPAGPPVRGRRIAGDAPKFSPAARTLMAATTRKQHQKIRTSAK